MRCPDCQNQVDKSANICGNCGAVIGSLFTNGFEDFTQSKVAVGPAGPDTAPEVPVIEEGAHSSDQRQIGTQIVAMDPESNRGTQIVEVPIPRVVRQAVKSKETGSDPSTDSDVGINADLDQALRHFFQRLHRVDRYAFGALCATFIFSFFPWTQVAGIGLVSGIEGLGAIAAGLAAGSLLFLYLRNAYRRFASLALLGQLLFAAGAAAVPIYLGLSASAATFVYGLVLTALAGVVSILLSLLRVLKL